MEASPTSPEFIPDDNFEHDFEAQVQLFALLAKPFQEPGLSYHNWDEHIVETYDKAMRLCDQCEQNGTQVNRLKVAFIVLGHDLGYSFYKKDKDVQEATGFESKESFSAHITGELLLSMGFEDEFIADVKEGIMATKLGMPCLSTEAKISRLADVANTYGPFLGFFGKFLKIVKEAREVGGPASGLTATIEQSCKIVEGFVTTADLRLGPWHDIQEVISAVKSNTEQLRNHGEEFVKKEILRQN